MQRFIFIFFSLAASLANADLAHDVACREIGFSKSIESRDLEAFKAFLDEDARFISDRPRRGIEEIAAGWSVFIPEDGPRIKWRPQFVEVLEDGTLALTRGPYRYRATNESGEELVVWGTFNSVWRRKDDGSWKVVFDAGGAAAEPPSDEVRALLDAEDDCGS
jgi:ketosteroid isomerase-like protein